MSNPQNHPAPLFTRIRDVFKHGFTIDWVTASFITITHVICLLATPVAYVYAPEGFWKIMLGWTLLHALVGSLSTTVYSHRLVSHGAVRHISWPVHLVFGFVGQVLAMQGSVRRWAAMHVIHHGVDRSGKHHLDPYSATWFTSAWRNFLWSHMLTYFFHHPRCEAQEKAYQSKSDAPLVWQEKLYLPLLIGLNFLLPLVLGFVLTGTVAGALGLLVAAIGGFILAQHNTWTVNSVTHMWGFVRGAFSSAKNNYVWLGPLGEGNHHADHHDFARDYRNGFGWSGWLLDPTRYVILALNALGLVRGLQRASKRQEAEIIARRELLNVRIKAQPTRWEIWEAKLETLKAEWLEAVHQWESFRLKRLKLKTMSLPRFELQQKLDALKAEMEVARRSMRIRKQAFFDAIYELRTLHCHPAA